MGGITLWLRVVFVFLALAVLFSLQIYTPSPHRIFAIFPELPSRYVEAEGFYGDHDSTSIVFSIRDKTQISVKNETSLVSIVDDFTSKGWNVDIQNEDFAQLTHYGDVEPISKTSKRIRILKGAKLCIGYVRYPPNTESLSEEELHNTPEDKYARRTIWKKVQECADAD